VAVLFLIANLGDLTKTAIEKYGPPITKTTVKVGKVEIDATDGSGVVSGLVLGNPEGFKSKTALEFDRVALQLDVGSVTGNPIIIKIILIDKPVVTYEISGKKSNFDAIKANVEKSLKTLSGGGKKSAGGKNEEPNNGGTRSSGQKVIIRDLVIQNGTVNATFTAFEGKGLSTGLPTIHLRDIGGKSKGVTVEEAVSQVLDAVIGSAKRAVGKLDLNSLKSAGKTAGEKAGSAIKNLQDKASEGLKKLFKD